MQEQNVQRRTFVLGALMAGVALDAGVIFATGQRVAQAGEADSTQYGFLVNTKRCVNCGHCVEACVRANHTPSTLAARRQVREFVSDFGMTVYGSFGCMHCEEPACVQVCPAGAITKRNDGIVVVDSNRCIGCKYCFQACPFQVPHYGPLGMDKCDCCLGAGVLPGDEPNCVRACMFEGLRYGPVSKLMESTGGTARVVEAATKPSYLML